IPPGLRRSRARAEEDTGAGGREHRPCRTRVVDGETRGGTRQVAEAGEVPRLLRRHEVARLEVGNLGGDSDRVLARVEALDGPYGRPAADEEIPKGIGADTRRRNHPDARDHDSAVALLARTPPRDRTLELDRL